MKTVFNTFDEVAYQWHEQKQDVATMRNGFFNGNKIYSYGYHFIIAERMSIGDHLFYLFNNSNYSNTTSKHQDSVLKLIKDDGVPILNVDCSDLLGLLSEYFYNPNRNKSAILELTENKLNSIKELLDKHLRARKRSYEDDINRLIQEIELTFSLCDTINKKDSNNFRKYILNFTKNETKHALSINNIFSYKIKCFELKFTYCNIFNEIVNNGNNTASKLIEWYKNNDNSELIKSEIEKLNNKIKRKRKQYIKEFNEYKSNLIKKWRDGDIDSLDIDTKYDDLYSKLERLRRKTMLRIKDGKIETSGRYIFDIKWAKFVYDEYLKFKSSGLSTSNPIHVTDIFNLRYRVIFVDDIIESGCHHIPFEELENIIKQIDSENEN